MAIPKFIATNFDTTGKNAAELYAAYIESLINQNIKTATVSELLGQIKLINHFVTQKTSQATQATFDEALNEAHKQLMPYQKQLTEYNERFKNQEVLDRGGVIVAVITCALLGAFAATLIALSFDSSLAQSAVIGMRVFGAWSALSFVASSAFFAHVEYKNYIDHSILTRELRVASHTISKQIEPTEDYRDSPALPMVEKTLFASWDGGFKYAKDAEQCAQNVLVDLNKLSNKLKAEP